MTTEFTNRPTGTTDNRADYQAAFLQQVHRLLQLGYEALHPPDFTNAQEDHITGELCKHMKHLTEDAPAERWMSFYSVHDQDPVNDVRAEGNGEPRVGKSRPRLDIRLVNKLHCPNPRFCVEAKRLCRSDSVSEYMNDEGLGAFICGEYARGDAAAGMLGYVQSESLGYWLPRIEQKIRLQLSADNSAQAQTWQKFKFRDGPNEVYLSSHQRGAGNPIAVYHTLFTFLSL